MAKKVQKQSEKFTVKDFKMWLRGMAEFQEDDWVPNLKQWRTILEKVETLEDNVQYVSVPDSKQNRGPQQAPNQHPQQANGPQQAPQAQTFEQAIGGVVNLPEPAAPRFRQDQRPDAYGAGKAVGEGFIQANVAKPNSFI